MENPAENAVEMVENNPSNPPSVEAVLGQFDESKLSCYEDGANLNPPVSNEGQNEEKMETNEEAAGTVQESTIDLQENEEIPSIAQYQTEPTVEESTITAEETATTVEELAVTVQEETPTVMEATSAVPETVVEPPVAQEQVQNDMTEQPEQESTESVENNGAEEVKSNQEEVARASNEQELKYWNAVKENPKDFTCWTYLLQFVEQENKLTSARKAFEAFLSRYPFCYGYWKKFADMEKKNGNLDRAREVFENGLEAIALSVDLWVHYLNFTSQTTKGQPNNLTAMRSLFERAITAAGEEFRSDKLWDAYIEWEKSQKQLQNVTAIYDRVLTVPTQNYTKHWKKFQDHINMNPLDDVLVSEELLKLKAEVGAAPPGLTFENEPAITPAADDGNVDGTANAQEVSAEEGSKPEDPETSEVRKKVIAQRKVLFDANELEVSKRWTFEEGIKRPYFHVKPLERIQLKNWRDYLDFEVSTGNHRRVVILHERCVIACALYEEFWQRFASYMEVHDCVEACENVYKRACRVHLPTKPHIHLAWAAFEEKHGNMDRAREILQNLDNAVPGSAFVKIRRANLERRSNQIPNACVVFEQVIQENSDIQLVSFYSIKYAKFLSKIAKNFEKAREVLKTAIEKDKENKQLYLQMLDLELTKPDVEEEKVEEVFALVKDCSLPDDVKEGFSQRRLEFLEDFSFDIVKITKAQEEHNKLYKSKTNPATGKKRPNDEGPPSGGKVAKVEETTDPNQYNQAQYDATTTDYSAAAAGGYPATSTYSYNTAQWPGYGAAQQPVYNYANWYQQYGQTYAQ